MNGLHNIMRKILSAAFLAIVALAPAAIATAADQRSPYRVAWDSPSEDWNGTMPLGNGEVCANVWFDSQARAHILVARTDSWDDYGHLAKVGAAEIDLFGDDFAEELVKPFRQELDVEKGMLTVFCGSEGKQTRISVWIDTNRPCIVYEVESDLEVAPRAALRPWRIGEGELLTEPMVSDTWWQPTGKIENVRVQNDKFLTTPALADANRVVSYHRNIKTKFYDEIAREQGLDDIPGYQSDPYANRTFGLLIFGDDARRVSEDALVGAKGRSRRFEIVAHTAQVPELDQWTAQISEIADEAAKTSIGERREKTLAYWREFSDRSWVRFSPNEEALKNATDAEREAIAAETADVSRGYALQRYIAACHGRGAYPIKFNGGLFTHAHVDKPFSHDYRRWGPGYWWQNTRLPYYSMCAAGDFELMKTFFDRYVALVPICEARAKKYLGVEGAYFPECIYLDGAVFPETYGRQPWNEREDKLQASGWHKREWVGGLELAFLAIQYYEFTGDEAFLKEKAVPTANSILRFFHTYYSVDPATGKLKMTPAQALETWWDCDNSAAEIGGIIAVAQKLLALPETLTTPEDRDFWRIVLKETPELPVRHDEKSGLDALAAAERFADCHNFETPELYSVFPFRLFSFEKERVALAENAFKLRQNHMNNGWAQDDVFAAYLGDAETARAQLVPRSRNGAKTERFPAFWGPNFDWIPDQDNGGILTVAVQSLALQTDGDNIFVAPALPKEWNVDFKLLAPKKTVVTGKVTGGKVERLDVEPKSREADVRICLPETE